MRAYPEVGNIRVFARFDLAAHLLATLFANSMTHILNARVAAFAMATALVACGPSAPVEGCSTGTISRLYLGQETPAGTVTDEQWKTFVADVMTPRFPAGFTVLDGRGQWRDRQGGLIHEPTRIVEFVHDGTPQQRALVRGVASAYKHRFSQQSVLVTQMPTTLCF